MWLVPLGELRAGRLDGVPLALEAGPPVLESVSGLSGELGDDSVGTSLGVPQLLGVASPGASHASAHVGEGGEPLGLPSSTVDAVEVAYGFAERCVFPHSGAGRDVAFALRQPAELFMNRP
jgi:hypothetical protein